jgi:hypothetical protein
MAGTVSLSLAAALAGSLSLSPSGACFRLLLPSAATGTCFRLLPQSPAKGIYFCSQYLLDLRISVEERGRSSADYLADLCRSPYLVHNALMKQRYILAVESFSFARLE